MDSRVESGGHAREETEVDVDTHGKEKSDVDTKAHDGIQCTHYRVDKKVAITRSPTYVCVTNQAALARNE